MASCHDGKKICAICIEEFKQPRFLPCHHTFCLPCLEDFVRIHEHPNSIECPVCRKPGKIPEGGVERFPVNYYCEVAPEDHFSCEACNKPARHVCFNCEQNYCDTCASAHNRMKVSREHKIKPFKGIDADEITKIKTRVFCPNHKDDEVKLICVTCNELICVVCMLTEHREHKTGDIGKEAGKKRQQLRDQILLSEKELQKSENKIHEAGELDRSIRQNFKYNMRSASEAKQRVLRDISSIFEKFENNIKPVLLRQQTLSRDISSSKIADVETFRQTIKNAEGDLKDETDVGLLKNFDTIMDNLKTIVVVQVPEVDATELNKCLQICISWLNKLERTNNTLKAQVPDSDPLLDPI